MTIDMNSDKTTYYKDNETIPDEIVFAIDDIVYDLLCDTPNEYELNENTNHVANWINGNNGITPKFLESDVEHALAVMGLIETPYTAKTWAKNNDIKITYMHNGYGYSGKNRYTASIYVGNICIDNNFDLATYEDIDDTLYDMILDYLYFFSDCVNDSFDIDDCDNDMSECEAIELTSCFLQALTPEAREEFTNGYIWFRE